MGMNIDLTHQLEEPVRSKVSSGMHNPASEVVREALRPMDEQDRIRQAGWDELRQAVPKGLDSGAGKPWDAAAVKRKAPARCAETPGLAKRAFAAGPRDDARPPNR